MKICIVEWKDFERNERRFKADFKLFPLKGFRGTRQVRLREVDTTFEMVTIRAMMDEKGLRFLELLGEIIGLADDMAINSYGFTLAVFSQEKWALVEKRIQLSLQEAYGFDKVKLISESQSEPTAV